MAGSQQPPLDEIQWNAPAVAQEMGGIQTNTVLPYFSKSPFFDPTSNNAILETQAWNNQNMFYIIQTREAFEGRLKTMQGIEFMVTHDPSENGIKVDNSGVWVIQKRNRRKKQGMSDELIPISTYYVVGANVYMAPSVGNIIGSRMLSAVTSLTIFLSTASALPTFTPATGHTYLIPAHKTSTPGSSLQTIQASKENTPMPGGTPMPALQETASQKSVSTARATSTNDYQGIQLLEQSYSLLNSYGSEFMDENPIVGEPGSFKLSKSVGAAFPSFKSTTKSSHDSFDQVATPRKGTVTPQLKTDDLPTPVKKLSKGGGDKSPTTPGGAKEKKGRKKSKAVGAGDIATPKVTTPR